MESQSGRRPPHRSVSSPQPFPSLPIQDKIKTFFNDDKLWKNISMEGTMVQFWNPVETISGRSLLKSVSGELCKIRSSFMTNLYRYRKVTIGYEYWVEDDESQLGPIGRAFKQQSPEYCPDVSCYSKQEFPFKDLAKKCRIVQYWALPVCEFDSPQQCIGVLEWLSTTSSLSYSIPFDTILDALKSVGLVCPGTHPDDTYNCNSRRRTFVSKMCMDDGLKFLGKIHQLPLILVWVPCLCDISGGFVAGDDNTGSFAKAESRITKMIPHLVFLGSKMLSSEYVEEINQITSCSAYLVANGRGLVGKAYQLKKPCFLKNISEHSISDYPLVHLIRSSGLAASFAIPLQIIHLELPPLVLEVFLPSQAHCDGKLEALLKSLLTTLSQEVSAHNVCFGLRQNEEFCVRTSHSDSSKIVYFDVRRSVVTLDSHEASVIVSKERIPSLNPTSVENPEDLSANRNATTTLDDLMQHSDEKLTQAAAALGVSELTLKRRGEKLGTHWLSQHKKHKSDCIQLDPQLPIMPVEAAVAEVNKASANEVSPYVNIIGKEASAGNSIPTNVISKVQSDGIYTMIVEATHKDDTVKFPFRSNSGIEELRGELAESFGLKGEEFKIKYVENGKQLMIARKKELRYRMEALRSSGQTLMYLLVVTST